MSESERKRAKQLFNHLTRHHNNSSSKILYQRVCDFVSTVVQDDMCLAKKTHGNRFRDLLCEFSLAYVPSPLQDEMVKHGQLVNGNEQVGEGSNGRIFVSGDFQGNPIVTKTKKKITEHSIYEIYINFVILNSMIIDKSFESNFIPTYGLFLCPTNEDGTEICLPMHKQEHLFLVQRKMTGDTFATHLQKGMTLGRFHSIVQELFQVLLALEKSPHQLYHTDLHCSNIMLCNDEQGIEHPVLLDFELSSFAVKDNSTSHRFRLNSLEHNYCKHDHVLSGAHDLILLFSNSLAYNNKDIQEYTLDVLERVCGQFWVGKNQPLQVSKSFFSSRKEHRWIYSILLEAEERLYEDREMVHEHNLSVLRKMTNHNLLQYL